MTSRPNTASLVITTRNRKDELRVALASAIGQTVPLDILVFDDASTDGTADLVRSKFPSVRLFPRTKPAGYILGRNEGATLATGDVVFSIDDDAEFTTPRVVEQTLADFDHPRVGAVAIPFVEPRKSDTVMQRSASADPADIEVVSHYIGTAHAYRRKLFLDLGAYHADFIHQGEEMDYCLRMLRNGYVVRRGHSDPINHYESPRRDLTRMHYFGRRNDILFAYLNTPARLLPVQIPGALALALSRAVRRPDWLWPQLKGAFAGFRDLPRFHSRRNPVPAHIWALLKRIRRNPGLPLTDFQQVLPPLPAQP